MARRFRGTTPKASTILNNEFLQTSSPGQTVLEALNQVPSVNFTNNDPTVAGQCLVGVSNAQWSSCCTLGSWHGNVVTVPVTLGQQFGYVLSGNSGYNGGLTNTSGTTWGCVSNATSVPSRGCATYYVACK